MRVSREMRFALNVIVTMREALRGPMPPNYSKIIPGYDRIRGPCHIRGGMQLAVIKPWRVCALALGVPCSKKPQRLLYLPLVVECLFSELDLVYF